MQRSCTCSGRNCPCWISRWAARAARLTRDACCKSRIWRRGRGTGLGHGHQETQPQESSQSSQRPQIICTRTQKGLLV
ncbi:mCG1050930 [Mus musculus]|nr:mCG1050930 [Mus musculus]